MSSLPRLLACALLLGACAKSAPSGEGGLDPDLAAAEDLSSGDGSPSPDLRPGPDLAGPDLAMTTCRGDGTRAVASTCSSATRCDCSGPLPTCLTTLDFGELIDLPGGYCSNQACLLNDDTSCGTGGVCADLAGDGARRCFARCTAGACRTDYACVNIAVDPSDINSRNVSVCLPRAGIVECDPTASPATQCMTIAGIQVSTLTNGNPNAACMRVGPDPVGQCRYLPCQIGPRNCPALGGELYGCFYFDVQRNTASPNPADTFKGLVCLPTPGVQKKDGDACTGGFNTCGDNFYCDSGVCRQLCYSGAAPTYAGGNALYKNAAAACAAGRTCQNVFALAGASWPGLCRP